MKKDQIKIKQADTGHSRAILNMEITYHRQNRTKEEQQTKGFVSLLLTSMQLRRLIEKKLVFVAMQKSVIVGYLIYMDLEGVAEIPFLAPMLEKVSHLEHPDNDDRNLVEIETLNGKPISFGSGLKDFDRTILTLAQICVIDEYAGQGIASELLNYAEKIIQKNYNARRVEMITEISTVNPRSIEFHTKRHGFSSINQYDSAGQSFHILYKRLFT